MNIRTLLPALSDRGSLALPAGSVFASLQREVDRLFDDVSRGLSPIAAADMQVLPSMDLAETDKEIELTVELPGLDEKDIDISVVDNVLTIRGEKVAETDRKDKNIHVVERAYGTFYRAVPLPAGVDPSAISAKMSKGVLQITIPKPPAAQRSKVEVKSESQSESGSQSESRSQSQSQASA